MKKYLPFFLFLLVLSGLLPGGIRQAWATQFVGGDLTYTSLGSNQYRVTLHYYQDCSGVLPDPFTLACRSSGCGSVATLTVPFVQQGPIEAGNPFCAALSTTPCQGPTGLPNYQLFTYAATLTLPPGQWTLSTLHAARPAMTSTAAGDLYVEATLDNRNQGTTAVANNSPQFAATDAPVQYACRQQTTTIALPATEADGDSLVYELAAPLQACNMPVTYLTPGNSSVLAPVSGSTAPCFFSFSGAPSGGIGSVYSPAYPIQLGLDTVGFCPMRTGLLRQLRFNAQAHSISLTPGIYNAPNGNTSTNRYQLAVLITEYRRIGGVRRIVGTVRREITVVVANCNGNYVPNPVTVATQSVGCFPYNTVDTTRIDVRTCSYARVTLNVSDPDNLRTPGANQLLTVTVPADLNTNPQLLGGGDVGTFSLVGNGTANPHGTFYFQPAPAAAGRTIYFNVRVEDNACPIRGIKNQVMAIRVVRGNVALVGSAGGFGPAVICAGNSLTLNGNILRPDSVRNLVTNTTLAQNFAYQWTTNPGGSGLPTVATTASIQVSPTLTTRYHLRITPNVTFWAGACSDTTSILVRVLPGPPAPTVSRSGTLLTSSALTGNQWYRDNALLPGATGRTLTATTNGAYAVTATVVTGATSCTSPLSAALTVLSAVRAQPGTSLGVAPNPTPDGRLQVTLTGYAQPVALSVLDALGRTVTQVAVPAPNPQGTTQEVNLSRCEAGLYLLQVRTATSLEVRRIVRQ